MAIYKCSKNGDTVARAAAKNRFHDWKTIWDANPDLKSKRGNPLILFTGDRYNPSDSFEIPSKDQSTERQSTDSDQKYEVPKQKLCLRLRILKGDFQPLADIPFKLEISGGRTWEGNTDSNGCVKVPEDEDGPDPEIPKDAAKGTLWVRVSQEAAATEEDPAPPPEAVAADYQLTWNLKIGRLDPLKEQAPDNQCISGVQQRLNNVGFYTGPVDGILGPNTKYAIQSFQSKFNLPIDGDPGQIALQDKLEEVHDKDGAVSRPTGTKPVTATIPDDKFLKTKVKDVGHVAPQWEGASPGAINTLVIAPEYKLTAELGDINDLFFEPETTDKGLMERLQVAGHFYFPLNHKKAPEAVKFAWKYYQDKFSGTVDKLKNKVKNWIVDGGKLPKPADDPEKPEEDNFAKIRVPGGFTYIEDSSWFKVNHDSDYKLDMSSEHNHLGAEQCLHDNPVLAAIPVKTKVEERYGSTGPWQKAKDVQLYFQLVKPYDLPDYDDRRSPLDQLNRPPLRESDMQTGTKTGVGPKKHVDAGMNHSVDASDPQVDNCHKDRGGKRGDPAAGNVLELKVDLANHKQQSAGTHNEKDKRPGFHEAHTNATRASVVTEPFINVPEEAPAQGDKHKHAIRCKSNEDGWSGVILRPSMTGGDRYRLRVYVGPDTLESDGTDPLACVLDTGTFVVWRNVRVSRILKLPYQNMSQTIKDEFVNTRKAQGKTAANNKIVADAEKYFKHATGMTQKDGKDVGYSDVDLSAKGDSKAAYEGFVKNMAYSFCEAEIDPGGKSVVNVKNADYEKALKFAVDHAKAHNFRNLDIDKLIITDQAKVTASNAFVLIPMKSPMLYNAEVGAGQKIKLNNKGTRFKNNATKKWYDAWFDNCILYPFAFHLADKGYRPGLTMVQMPTISTWHGLNYLVDYSIGLGWRTCIMRGGADLYPYDKLQQPVGKPGRLKRAGYTDRYLDSHSYAALTAHEWGHCLFREHAPPDPDEDGDNTDVHDAEGDGYCVMTYLAQEGHFCGKCVLALAGWKGLNTIP